MFLRPTQMFQIFPCALTHSQHLHKWIILLCTLQGWFTKDCTKVFRFVQRVPWLSCSDPKLDISGWTWAMVKYFWRCNIIFFIENDPTPPWNFFMFAMYRSSLYRDASSFAIIQNTTRGPMEKNTGGVCYKCSPFLRQLARIGIEMRPIFSHNTRAA